MGYGSMKEGLRQGLSIAVDLAPTRHANAYEGHAPVDFWLRAALPNLICLRPAKHFVFCSLL